jgi:hypothetical protein
MRLLVNDWHACGDGLVMRVMRHDTTCVRVRVRVPLFRMTHFTPNQPPSLVPFPTPRRRQLYTLLCPPHQLCGPACGTFEARWPMLALWHHKPNTLWYLKPHLTASHPHLAHMHMQRVDVVCVRSSTLIKHDGRHERACGGSGRCRAGIETPAQGILWGEEAGRGCIWSSELHVMMGLLWWLDSEDGG